MCLGSLDDRYLKSPSIVSREIAGEVILVPIRRTAGDLESIYVLNETAARMWELIDGQRSVGQIRDQVVAEFEVEAAEAEGDLRELLEQLSALDAVQRA
jgi:hypothetical protein